MSIALVQDEAALRRVCDRVARSAWIVLDTEFTRERTFYARLGLLQLATEGVIACVDPLALDLAPLLDVLYENHILKVLHAGRQDLEVFHDLRGAVPRPVFDTQIAAALLGYTEQIGYATLVEAVTGVKLAKLHTRTNWEARPLTPAQLDYARDDVSYLRDVYQALAAQLERRRRLAWLREECEALTDPARYRNEPDTAYLRLGSGQLLAPTAQPLLKALAAWRERTAQTRDRPRGWIATDATLVEIARAVPATLEALGRVPHASAAMVQTHGPDILRVVQAAAAAPPERLWPVVQPPTAAEQTLAQALLARVKAAAQTHGVNPGIIATRRTVLALIRGRTGPLVSGWRRALVGEELLALAEAGR